MAAAPNEHDALFATRDGNWLSLNNINTRLRQSILKDIDIGTRFELRLLRSATGTVIANEFGVARGARGARAGPGWAAPGTGTCCWPGGWRSRHRPGWSDHLLRSRAG